MPIRGLTPAAGYADAVAENRLCPREVPVK
jgi:hypothetical protein